MQRGEPISPRMLKAARTLAGVTQRQLADAANLHPKSIAYWEKHGGYPSRYGRSGLNQILEALCANGVQIIEGHSLKLEKQI